MREWFDIRDEAEGPLRIDIYGPIGKSWWDDSATSAKDVMEAIKGADGKPIEVHVNSEGGSVFDGFAIHTLLRDSESHVIAYIDGLAASAASYIVEAADRVVMSDVAWYMIHNASGAVWGDKAEMRRQADVLENIDATIASVYASRSEGHDAADFRALMDEETWMDAATAKSYGLVDEISAALPAVAMTDLSGEAAIASAPEEARAAIMRMVAGDTSANMQPVNDGTSSKVEGAKAQAPAKHHVIDGRVYLMKGRYDV